MACLRGGLSRFLPVFIVAMRIMLYLLLGVVVLGVLLYGGYLVRRSRSPYGPDLNGGETQLALPGPVVGRWGWWLFLPLGLWMMWALLDRVTLGSEVPADLTPPPSLNERATSPGRYY